MLAHAKCNVGRLQKSRELSLTEAVIDPFSDSPIFTSRIELGEQCDISADDLVKDGGQKRSARVQAERFLRELLADGPHRASEVYELAEDADVSARTLKRAKKDLGVDSFQKEREWWWVLCDEESPEPDDDEDDE